MTSRSSVDHDFSQTNIQNNPPKLLSLSDLTETDEHSDTDPDKEPNLQPTPGPHTPRTPKTEGCLHIRSILENSCETMTCRFSTDGSLLAVGLSNGSIKVFRTETEELVQTLQDRDTILTSLPVTNLRFTHSGSTNCSLLATYASGIVRCWYIWGGQCVWSVKEPLNIEEGAEVGEAYRQTLSLSISPSGKQAVAGGSDSSIYLYDLNTQQIIQSCRASPTMTVMDGHHMRVFAVMFHPERETQFISGGWDNTIQFWDTREQHAVRMISGPHICGDALDIDPTANQILSGSWRKHNSLEVWDYDSGNKVTDISEEPNGKSKIYTCYWTGDSIVAGGSQGNMLKVINRQSLMTESRLYGLSSAVFSSSVCPSGKQAGLIAATSGNRVFLLEKIRQVSKRRR